MEIGRMMISPAALEKNGVDWARYHPVGTGPSGFVDFQRDASASFKRFENYWDGGKPYWDSIEMRFIRDPQTLKAAFMNGDIDVFGTGDRQLIAEMLAAGDPHIQGMSGTSVNVLIASSAGAGSPLADKNVRLAISHAVIPAPHVDRDVAVAVQQFLAGVGIQAEIETPESTRFVEYRTKGWTGLFIDRLGFFPNYGSFVGFYFSSEAPSVFPSLRRPDGLEEWIEEARSLPSEDPAMSQQMHRLLLDDVTHIRLTTGSRHYFTQPYVRDTHQLEASPWPWWTAAEAWLDR